LIFPGAGKSASAQIPESRFDGDLAVKWGQQQVELFSVYMPVSKTAVKKRHRRLFRRKTLKTEISTD
jgi:hypothetical protein